MAKQTGCFFDSLARMLLIALLHFWHAHMLLPADHCAAEKEPGHINVSSPHIAGSNSKCSLFCGASLY